MMTAERELFEKADKELADKRAEGWRRRQEHADYLRACKEEAAERQVEVYYWSLDMGGYQSTIHPSMIPYNKPFATVGVDGTVRRYRGIEES